MFSLTIKIDYYSLSRMSKRVCFHIFIILFLILCTAFFTSCRKEETIEVRSKTIYSYFDTVTFIYSYANDSEETFFANAKIVEDILRDYHKMLDIYNQYEGMNNLCTVNLNAGKEPVKVDRRLIDVLLFSKKLCEITEGKMDIMMGSVLSLWHEGRISEPQYLPSDEALDEASKHMGFDLLEIDEKNLTVRITDSEASIDVGAIGKGYATEVAAKALQERGVSGYVINSGGNIRCIGNKADGSKWVAGIKNPSDPETLAVRLQISDCACVTSGGYERYLLVDGKKYSHLIDKSTLRPASYFGSVTVITHDSALADGLATGLFCMSYEDGLALVRSLDDVKCIWIENDGTVRKSDEI